MNIREIATSRLREYENNPRNNDLAVEKVKYSIERFGFLFPVIVDMNYTIICGHTRVRACRELGLQFVPCIIADELTDEQINLFRLIDNKTSEYSDWDFEKLKSELSAVDLTLEKNQLLLERFELTAEVFDIEPEQAEIKIPTFNFMGENDTSKNKKPTVSTIHIEADESAEDNDSESVEVPVSNVSAETASAEITSNDDNITVSENDATITSNTPTESNLKENSAITATAKSVDDTTQDQDTKKSHRTMLIQFRFGDVAFYISQVELNCLNEKYAEYMDSGEMLKCSFVDYLLRGVKQDA